MLQKFFVALIFFGIVPLLGQVAAQEESGQDSQKLIRSLEQEIAQLREQLILVSERAVTAGVIAAIHHIDSVGFHEIDVSLQNGEIDPRYSAAVAHAVTVARATDWPEELQSEVAEFVEAANSMAEALEAEDVSAGAAAAKEAHDKQHVLSHAVYATLAGSETGAVHSSPAQIPEGAVELSLEIGANGGPVDGAATHRVKRGDSVALVIQSASSGVLHLHGYRLEWELEPGRQQVVTFAASTVGRFPLELHPADGEAGISVGYLEVHP